MEGQRKGNSGDPAIKFQQKKAESILRVIKVDRLRNSIQVCDPRLLHILSSKKCLANILIFEMVFTFIP